MYDCDFGFKRAGVSYFFDHVNNFQIEDPESTKLVRGANGTDKIGLAYKEGIKDAKKVTVTIMSLSQEIKDLLDAVFLAKERIDIFCISRSDGSSKNGKNCVLSQAPQQLTVDESAESMDVALVFETFDLSEVHKA